MHHFDWSGIGAALPTLWTGAIVTFKITVLAIVIGIVWGTVLAIMRLSPFKPFSWFARIYVTLFRSIPLVMVLLWFFLIVPQVLQNVLDFRRISTSVSPPRWWRFRCSRPRTTRKSSGPAFRRCRAGSFMRRSR